MGWLQRVAASLAPPATPAAPPLRPLTLPRLMNTLLNQFANRGAQNDFGMTVYLRGDGNTIPIKGGFPIWVYCEFNPLNSLKTGRVRIPMPDSFRLLTYFGSASVNTKGGYRVNVYDVNRRKRLTDRPINFQDLAGNGSATLIQGGSIGSRQAAPYAFQ